MKVQVLKVPDSIIVEKKEQILGNFNGDGTPALMGVNTGSHASGQDQQIQPPPDAFVYSDTKALKIKDPQVLKMFNKIPKRGGYTPAEIAAQYDLQKFTKILSDPKSDNTTRKTAELMTQNYLQKLQQLADTQESMKQAKGIAPPDQQVPMQQYGGPNMRNSMMYSTPPKKVRVTGVPKSDFTPGNTTPVSQVFDANGKMSFVPDYAEGEGEFRFDQNPVPTDVTSQFNTPYVMGNNLQASDDMTDTSPTIGESSSGNAMDIAKTGAVGAGNAMTGYSQSPQRQDMRFTRPDRMALLNSGLNLASIHKYLPWEAPVQGVVPQTVFMDPTRALAANSEQANSMANYASRSGNGPSTIANYLALQGQAGKNAADIVGQYANQNAAIANSANQGAAETTNKLMEAQRARLARLHQGNTVAAQQYDNSQREARADLLNTYTNAWKNRAYMNDLNQTNQLYQRDPNTGFMRFNSPNAQAEFQKILNNTQGYSPGIAEKVNGIYQDLLKQPAYQTDAGKIAALKLAQRMAGVGEHETVEYTPGNTVKSRKESGVYSGPKKFGGAVNRLGKFIKQ